MAKSKKQAVAQQGAQGEEASDQGSQTGEVSVPTSINPFSQDIDAMLDAPLQAIEQFFETLAQFLGLGSFNIAAAAKASAATDDTDVDGENAPTEAVVPPSTISFLSHLPDTRLPSLAALTKTDVPVQKRIDTTWKETRNFGARMFLTFLLPLSWFLTWANTTYAITTRLALFPITLSVSFYETNIHAVYPNWTPSIIGMLNALFPNGLPSFPTFGEIMTRLAEAMQPKLPDISVPPTEDGSPRGDD